MLWRLYKGNLEIAKTHADAAHDALGNFMEDGVIPDEVLKEMKLEEAGYTAVMPDGAVWQIRSLLKNVMGW